MFNVVAKGLSGLMREAKRNNTFNGYLVRIDNVEVNLLQYVDDIIFSERYLEECLVH